eukprot:1981935-Rhodomonas_salina.3
MLLCTNYSSLNSLSNEPLSFPCFLRTLTLLARQIGIPARLYCFQWSLDISRTHCSKISQRLILVGSQNPCTESFSPSGAPTAEFIAGWLAMCFSHTQPGEGAEQSRVLERAEVASGGGVRGQNGAECGVVR